MTVAAGVSRKQARCRKFLKGFRMDTRTGELLTEEQAKQRANEMRRFLSTEQVTKLIVQLPNSFMPTPKQKKKNRIGRNDKCPCGSGLKFKRCCMRNRPALLRLKVPGPWVFRLAVVGG